MGDTVVAIKAAADRQDSLECLIQEIFLYK
jgi:hypothetical protein